MSRVSSLKDTQVEAAGRKPDGWNPGRSEIWGDRPGSSAYRRAPQGGKEAEAEPRGVAAVKGKMLTCSRFTFYLS